MFFRSLIPMAFLALLLPAEPALSQNQPASHSNHQCQPDQLRIIAPFADQQANNTGHSVTYTCETITALPTCSTPPCVNATFSGDANSNPDEITSAKLTDIDYDGNTTTTTYGIYVNDVPTGQTEILTYKDSPTNVFSQFQTDQITDMAISEEVRFLAKLALATTDGLLPDAESQLTAIHYDGNTTTSTYGIYMNGIFTGHTEIRTFNDSPTNVFASSNDAKTIDMAIFEETRFLAKMALSTTEGLLPNNNGHPVNTCGTTDPATMTSTN